MKKRDERKLPKRETDARLFHCLKCKRLYEWKSISNGSWLYYSTHTIPTYGKKKRTCEQCSKKEDVK